MATLTAKKRNNLPKGAFALPKSKRYPIHDAAHARNALARVAQHGNAFEQRVVRAAVARKYPDIGKAGTSKGKTTPPTSSRFTSSTSSKKAKIRAAFQKQAKTRGVNMSAEQLAVIDLAVDLGWLDLAGTWAHGWVPLDDAAKSAKRGKLATDAPAKVAKALPLPPGSRIRETKTADGVSMEVHYRQGSGSASARRIGAVVQLGDGRFKATRSQHLGTYKTREEAHRALLAHEMKQGTASGKAPATVASPASA